MTKTKKLRCKKCGYEWTYKGISEYYTSCPRCMYKVHVVKNKVE